MNRSLKIGSLSTLVLVLSGACHPDFAGLTSGDDRGGSANGGTNAGGSAGCDGDCTSGAGGSGGGDAARGGMGGSASTSGSGGKGGRGSGIGGDGGANEGGTAKVGGTGNLGGEGGTSIGGSGGEAGAGIEECFPSIPTGDPPILRFDFEDDSDVIADVSGNGNDGMLQGGRWIADGWHGRALEFQEKGQYATFPGAVVSALDAMTLAMWVRLDEAPAGSTLFEFGSDESHRIALTANTGSGMRLSSIAGGEEEALVLPRALPLGAWLHVAAVIAAGKAILYVDGIEIGKINASIAPSDISGVAAGWIGKSHDGDVDLKWALDDFRLYDRGLSREQVAELAVPDYLYFDFDEPCGLRVHDRSEKGLIGELPRGGTFVSGRIGGSLELDGVDQYVALPQGIVKDCDDFTLAFWVQRTSATGISEHVIDFGQNQRTFLYVTPQARGGGSVRFAMKLNGGENDVGAEFALTGEEAIPLGLWQHIAVVIQDDTGYGTLYVNGRQYSSQPLPNRPSDLGATIANTIGRSQYYNAALGPDPFYAGRIDDLRISCRPFSAAEVAFIAANP